MHILRTTAAVASLLIFVSSAFAGCEGLPNAENIKDGTWLFKTQTGSWRPVRELGSHVGHSKSRLIRFVYVVNDLDDGKPRSGILVIKSAQPTRLAKDREGKDVVLVRKSFRRTANCEVFPKFSWREKVSSKSYDTYHDIGYSTDHDATLKRFHVSYNTRTGCKLSDDAGPDAFLSGRRASNIAQFSFKPSVVADGQYSQLLDLIMPTRAYAAELPTHRLVEMKKYVADENGLACVAFQVSMTPGGLVRINDLERRTPFRAPEQSWVWRRR